MGVRPRTNKHSTLKQNLLTRADLDNFVACYRANTRHQRVESERFKRYMYDELIARDKVSLDLFWLRNESHKNTDNLPLPAILATEDTENFQSSLTEINALTSTLSSKTTEFSDIVPLVREGLSKALPGGLPEVLDSSGATACSPISTTSGKRSNATTIFAIARRQSFAESGRLVATELATGAKAKSRNP